MKPLNINHLRIKLRKRGKGGIGRARGRVASGNKEYNTMTLGK